MLEGVSWGCSECGVVAGVVPESDCFVGCQLIHSGKRRIELGCLVVVAFRRLNSRTVCYRMRVVVCRAESNSQQRSDVKKRNRGCNKRSARTRGEILNVQRNSHSSTHQTQVE